MARELHKGGVAMNQLSTEDLKQYLFHVRDLEVSCYKQREYIKSLEALYKNEKPKLEPLQLTSSTSNKLWNFFGNIFVGLIIMFLPGAITGGVIGLIVSIIKKFNITITLFGTTYEDFAGFIVFLILSIICGVVIGGIIGFFISVKSESEARAKNEKIEESNKKATADSALKAKMISEETAKAKRTLTETSVLLNNYYSSGVVYPKYQGLIPVTMFCEYLASGRCDTLTGHEGAYNIYENEIRLNLIIVKLEEVVDKLDQIQQNQYMLASQLEQITRELQGLNSAVATQTATLERIEDNTEVSNYYNRITAANTDFLTWAKTYELIRNS